MVATLRPLLSRTADDLMSQPVLLIPREMSLTGAAHLLTQANVSGAPVVDDEGRCVGVLSTTDFMHLAEKDKLPPHAEQKPVYSWQIVDSECDPQESVENFMNRDPVTVTQDTHVGDIARKMIDAHIHRVFVVDDRNHPIGVVSSTDILGAVAQESRI
jgi:predicted transcriptional regulator